MERIRGGKGNKERGLSIFEMKNSCTCLTIMSGLVSSAKTSMQFHRPFLFHSFFVLFISSSFSLCVCQMAERFGLPVITLVDTVGAWPTFECERDGQSEVHAAHHVFNPHPHPDKLRLLSFFASAHQLSLTRLM